MKRRALGCFLSILLILTLFPSLSVQGARAAEAPAIGSWASGAVAEAIEAGLIPSQLQGRYQDNITRGEFSGMAVQLLRAATGLETDAYVLAQTGQPLAVWQQADPFNDCSDPAVIAAYALGIVSGRGAGQFDPGASITRQEAAALLTRTARLLGEDIALTPAAPFRDQAEVAAYFLDAVNFVAAAGIMQGVGGGRFQPLGTYTREQAAVTAYRLYLLVVPGGAQAAPALTEGQVYDALMALQADYPEGMPWTNDNFYASRAMNAAGLGCEAFALICSDAAFGTCPVRSHTSFDRIRVGDIIRIGDYHTVVVLDKQADAVIVVEGNYNSSIHWGRTITRSSLEQEGFSVRTRYPAADA